MLLTSHQSYPEVWRHAALFPGPTKEGEKRRDKEREGGKHQWTVMESGEQGEDASTADRVRPPFMVRED